MTEYQGKEIRDVLCVKAIEGPDRGRSGVFSRQRISIGRDDSADFVLQDSAISRLHGYLEWNAESSSIVYRDLNSFNGSYLRLGEEVPRFDNPKDSSLVRFKEEAHLILGRTLLHVSLSTNGGFDSSHVGEGAGRKARSRSPSLDRPVARSGPSSEEFDPEATIVLRIKSSPEELQQRISDAEKLQTLFGLARQLNRLNRLDAVLDVVFESSMKLFPLANFFTVVLCGEEPDDELEPFYVRLRQAQEVRDPRLSQSLLRQVIEWEEAILYIRENQAGNLAPSVLAAEIDSCLCAPLPGQNRLLGVIQLDSRGTKGMFQQEDLELFTLLASSTAFAMERAELTASIYKMFEGFVQASITAIDARDPTTAGHSQRVADYTVMTAERLNEVESGPLSWIQFRSPEITELRYAALLHDFGKIGVREEVLQKPSRLPADSYTMILQRIELFQALSHRDLYTRLIHEAAEQREPVSGQELARLEEAYRGECRKLEHFRAVLLDLQSGRPLTDEINQFVREMAEVTYVDSTGTPSRLLTAEDLENLSIPWGSLNPRERAHIQSHAEITEEYLNRIPWSEELRQVPCIAGMHHEKLDGSGYPGRVNAPEIPPQVRILTICDIFDALTAADRPYKKAKPIPVAIDILQKDAARGALDKNLVDFFADRIVPQIGTDLPVR